jgi:threonine dehydrogenase-like Zn-dependent dehydrogenase
MAVDETIPALGGDFSFPLKYGYATVGRVVGLGPDVASEWEGRLVFAFQPHQSHCVTTPDAVLPLPAGISAQQAAFLPNMETAVNFLMDGQPLIGEQVVVVGQGIVGLLTTSLLARFPVGRLVSLDRYAVRREHSLGLGAQLSMDPDTPDVMDQLRVALRDGQLGQSASGADLTYELSGNPAALDLAIAATGFDGRVIIGSWYGHKRAAIDLGGRFHRSRIRLISSQVSSLASEWTGRWTKARRLRVAWRMLEHGHGTRLTNLITHRFPFRQAAEAYVLLDQQPQATLQILLTYDGC